MAQLGNVGSEIIRAFLEGQQIALQERQMKQQEELRKQEIEIRRQSEENEAKRIENQFKQAEETMNLRRESNQLREQAQAAANKLAMFKLKGELLDRIKSGVTPRPQMTGSDSALDRIGITSKFGKFGEGSYTIPGSEYFEPGGTQIKESELPLTTKQEDDAKLYHQRVMDQIQRDALNRSGQFDNNVKMFNMQEDARTKRQTRQFGHDERMVRLRADLKTDEPELSPEQKAAINEANKNVEEGYRLGTYSEEHFQRDYPIKARENKRRELAGKGIVILRKDQADTIDGGVSTKDIIKEVVNLYDAYEKSNFKINPEIMAREEAVKGRIARFRDIIGSRAMGTLSNFETQRLEGILPSKIGSLLQTNHIKINSIIRDYNSRIKQALQNLPSEQQADIIINKDLLLKEITAKKK